MNDAGKNVIENVIRKLEEIRREEDFDSLDSYKTFLESLKEKQEELRDEIEEDIDNLENAIDYLEQVEYESNKDLYLEFAIDSLEDIVF